MEQQRERFAFRLEGKDGKGPWTTSEPFGHAGCLPEEWDCGNTARSPGAMPSPVTDRKLEGVTWQSWRSDWLFAFPSIERLRYWFCPVMLAYAHEVGARMRVFKVKHYALYENQIVFNRTSAEEMATVPLTRLIGAPHVDAAWLE